MLLAGLASVPFAARAYPDGAPWTALDDPAQGCASCHFDSAPVADSDALIVEGLPSQVRAGEAYPLTLRFTPEDAEVAGFLASFRQGGEAAGAVAACPPAEANGAAARSVASEIGADGSRSWRFTWTAPNAPSPVALHLAALAGNADASPLGDTVHLKTLVLEVREAEP